MSGGAPLLRPREQRTAPRVRASLRARQEEAAGRGLMKGRAGKRHEIDPRKLRVRSDTRAAAFTFRHDPRSKNALGFVRLSMSNKDEVFIHDTPEKALFERDYRFLSHSCVRVDGVYDLASWLLQGAGEPQWDQAALRKERKEVEEGKTETIKLRSPPSLGFT